MPRAGDGVARRLSHILPRRGALILPLDGGLIDGPTGGLADLGDLLSPDLLESVDAILGFRGILNACGEALTTTPFIMNLSASTVLSNPTLKSLIDSVESAVRLGADAVCYQIHFSDEGEASMLRDVGAMVAEASGFGMPVMLTAYPRRTVAGVIDNYDDVRVEDPGTYAGLVGHAVRAAVELGADVVKTAYTGTIESFTRVVDSAAGVPVVVAGGALAETPVALRKVRDAMASGAWGVAYGRQIFQHPRPAEMARLIQDSLAATPDTKEAHR